MSEETLRRFIQRLNEDETFRDGVQADPESAFAAWGLSPAEQAALSSGDEDMLRRLAGGDASGFMYAVGISSRVGCLQQLRPQPTANELQPGCPIPRTEFPQCR